MSISRGVFNGLVVGGLAAAFVPGVALAYIPYRVLREGLKCKVDGPCNTAANTGGQQQAQTELPMAQNGLATA